ncbi:DUF1294 domain-containing protein [Serpentinicella alkaliphila]|nr:DUF1294 domain-containing protein [Serpentinicella alkaliphila]
MLFIFIIYLIAVNIFSFALMFIDKYKAKRDQWRIKESTFIVLSFVGGSIGVLIGMVAFRHKTNKQKFYIGVPIFYLINIIVFYIIINRFV